MKPQNFPARKLARQLAANHRPAYVGITAKAINLYGIYEGPGTVNPMDAARKQRTKKNRSSK